MTKITGTRREQLSRKNATSHRRTVCTVPPMIDWKDKYARGLLSYEEQELLRKARNETQSLF